MYLIVLYINDVSLPLYNPSDILSFNSDRRYTHVDGSSPVWAKWKEGEPDGSVDNGHGKMEARCAVFNKRTGEVIDDICDEAEMFVCHKGNYDIASVQII